MSNGKVNGSVFKRCACTGPDGPALGKDCPQLGSGRHGSWYYVVAVKGTDGRRRQHRKGGFATKGQAERALKAVQDKVDRGVRLNYELTVGDYLDEWLKGRTIRAKTRDSYGTYIRLYLKPHIGHIVLENLRDTHIRAMYADITAGNPDRVKAGKRPVGPTSIARLHATLRKALNDAVKRKLIGDNQAAYVELPEPDPAPVHPWETTEELGRFLDAAGTDRLGALFHIMAMTGLRRGEAFGLRWSDVDLTRGELVVRQQLVDVGGRLVFGPPKTRDSKNRRLTLDDQTLGTLLAHRLAQDTERDSWGDAYSDHGLVFCREDGSPLRPEYVTRVFKRIIADAGLRPIRLHDLRHGSASLQLASGIPIEIVSKRLGHSGIAITLDTYGHLLEGVDRAAAQTTADYLAKSRAART